MDVSYDDSYTKMPIFGSENDDLATPIKNYKKSEMKMLVRNENRRTDDNEEDIDDIIDGVANRISKVEIGSKKIECINENISNIKKQIQKEVKTYEKKYEEDFYDDLIESIEDRFFDEILNEQINFIIREFRIYNCNIENYSDYINEIDNNYRNTIISKYQIDLTGGNLQCLKDGQWLNDNVVNFYYAMLQERNDHRVKNEKEQPVRFFNTYFYNKLIQGGKYNYAGVRRWSRKFDIFSQDKIFIPINTHNMHWTLIVLDMFDKTVYYVDSLGGSGDYIFTNIIQYLKDEHMDKKKTEYDEIKEWECISCNSFTPQQHNGSDCGVFMLTATEFLSEGFTTLHFKQSEMSYFRKRLLCLIMKQSLIE